MEEINLFLNSMKMEELENLKDLINSHIETREKEERKEKYNKAINNIIKEIDVIINECNMGNEMAMDICKYEYSGQNEDIEMSWWDLQTFLEDYLI